MELSVAVSPSTKPIVVKLPSTVRDDVEFELQVNGATWKALVKRQAKVLFIKKNELDPWKVIRARTVTRLRAGEDQEVSVLSELIRSGVAKVETSVYQVSKFGQDAANSASSAAKQLTVRSQITGKVLKVLVKAGESVSVGQNLFVIEAMKMENRVLATMAGSIASVKVSEGQSVSVGAELAKFAAGAK